MSFAYTVFQGRVGDHNDLAMPGARSIGESLARRTGVQPFLVGTPEPALSIGWREELDAAMPALRQLQARFEQVLADRQVPVAATSRCAASLATLPAVARHHPTACVVWFDAHADLNTPASTTSGYLGGLALSGPVGLWDSGLGAGLGLDRVVLVGQRSIDPYERELIARRGIPHVTAERDLAGDLRRAIAGRPVYVHLDCDVLDPGIVPTDYVHENGLTLDDLRRCCEVIADHERVGIEIAEFQNSWEPGGEPVSPEPLLDALEPLLRNKPLRS
jgi:arginase